MSPAAPCPGCRAPHADPEAWLAPLRAGDPHAALEALVGQWLAPVRLPRLARASLAEALRVLGPALEPVLCCNHLRLPAGEGGDPWRFAFEYEGVWRAAVDGSDRVVIEGQAARGALGDFLLGFVLHELSLGLPVQRFAEGTAETFRSLPEVPSLAPWEALGYGGAQCFYATEGVVASALDGPDRHVQLGARCPLAMKQALRRLPPGFVVHTTRRRPPDARPWHER